jgi:hypothetical protein
MSVLPQITYGNMALIVLPYFRGYNKNEIFSDYYWDNSSDIKAKPQALRSMTHFMSSEKKIVCDPKHLIGEERIPPQEYHFNSGNENQSMVLFLDNTVIARMFETERCPNEFSIFPFVFHSSNTLKTNLQ